MVHVARIRATGYEYKIFYGESLEVVSFLEGAGCVAG